MNFAAIILAAGKGTRMKSALPKVLHPLLGRPMINYVTVAAKGAGVDQTIVVLGHEAEQIVPVLDQNTKIVYQRPLQLGTGHALQLALPAVAEECDKLLVLCGDTPLLTAVTLKGLVEFFNASKAACTVLSTILNDSFGYGRIVRDQDGNLLQIIEEKDASDSQKQIKEVNSGCYCFDVKCLREVICEIKPQNAQGEYYLTDVITALRLHDKPVNVFVCHDSEQVLGINDRVQLAAAGTILRRRKNRQLMCDGVTLIDPDTTYIDAAVNIAADTVIEPNTYLRGNCRIGSDCHIGPNADIADSSIGSGCIIHRSMVRNSNIGNNCEIGPFAYLRPGTVLANFVKAGHFVEIKKSEIGEGSKVPHLSYIGDCTIGTGVNIGCGTITCNYDGATKHPTIIEDRAFVGSNTNLVAPVKVGKDSVIGAGSTITKDVPDEALAIARSRQTNIEHWSKQKHKK